MNIQERRNKEGKITSYRIRVFDHRDVNGKQVFKTLSVKYDPDKSEAWNRKNAEKQGIIFEKGVEELTATDSRITFDKYTEYFLKIKEQQGVSSSTILSYNFRRSKLAPFIGHIQLKNLTPNAINKAYTEMIESGVTRKYVHDLHVFIHNVLQLALREGIIPRNYADAAMPPKKEHSEVKAISEIEMKNFFVTLYSDDKNYFYQVLFSLLLATGCRVGELCALSWDHIDFKEKRIHICQHFTVDHKGRHVEEGCKTVAGERWLYMDDSIMKMLKDYRTYYTKKVFEYGSKWNMETKAVFFSRKNPGNYLSPNTVRRWLEIFTEKHNLPKLHPHQFRHTSISLQLQAGISVPDAAKRAGHSRPDFTLSVYAHTLKNNDTHCCEAITRAIPKLPQVTANKDIK